MDVQTQAWTNSLLHLTKPQSKHTFIFKAATPKRRRNIVFWLMDVQTQAWTNSLLHLPKTQSKHTFIFTAATHKRRSNIAAFAPHVGKNWRSYAVCLAWCTNVECASTPPEAALQRSADDNRREHKHRVLHSGRTMHAQCTRQCTPQCTATKRCKYHVFSQRLSKKTPKKKQYFAYIVLIPKNANHMVFTAFCGRALWSALPCALYVHCAKPWRILAWRSMCVFYKACTTTGAVFPLLA